jgi:methenyltetrahydromethanopterin cyclohydrolase
VSISPSLNERAQRQADYLAANAAALRIAVSKTPNGARLIDCGISAPGGLQAGLGMARVCLAGMAEVSLVSGEVGEAGCPVVQVFTDLPVLACMASQYAGWQITVGKYFAMGSGPMRAAWAREDLYKAIGGQEKAPVGVGVLEADKLPDDTVTAHLAGELKITPDKLTLLVAPAQSMAGTVQVVARSLETALHKLNELKFDLGQVVSGFGAAPLPPVGRNMLQAIGRTNDAILYGGRVVLWVRAEDKVISEIGPKVPSNASADYGAPFAAIFKRCNQDFYKIDPLLFSPAEVVFHNLKTGRSQAFGSINPDTLKQSFFAAE